MKKLKKDPDTSRQTSLTGQIRPDQVEIEKLCKQFVDSIYYRKAMADPGYVREQAIFDFLTSLGWDSDIAGKWTQPIRSNYFRAF